MLPIPSSSTTEFSPLFPLDSSPYLISTPNDPILVLALAALTWPRGAAELVFHTGFLSLLYTAKGTRRCKLRILRWGDYPGCSGEPHIITRTLVRWTRKTKVREGCVATKAETGVMQLQPRNANRL